AGPAVILGAEFFLGQVPRLAAARRHRRGTRMGDRYLPECAACDRTAAPAGPGGNEDKKPTPSRTPRAAPAAGPPGSRPPPGPPPRGHTPIPAPPLSAPALPRRPRTSPTRRARQPAPLARQADRR